MGVGPLASELLGSIRSAEQAFGFNDLCRVYETHAFTIAKCKAVQ